MDATYNQKKLGNSGHSISRFPGISYSPFSIDARLQQIVYLGSFLVFGLFWLKWDIAWIQILMAFTGCLLTQLIFAVLYKKPLSSLQSALISALGLCLLFRADVWWVMLLAAILSIAGKFIIRFRKRHFFNPTNFGIIVTIFLTGQGWVSPGQWGNNGLITAFFLITGMNVLFKVGRMDTGVLFLLTFAGAQFAYHILYLGWPLDFFFHQLTSGTLLLFAFFMITDPMTTPGNPKARILWAMGVGLLAFFMTQYFNLHTAPLYALFLMAPLTVAFNLLFKHKKFNWRTS